MKGLHSTKRTMIKLVEEAGQITARAIAARIGITESTVNWHLRDLKKLGFVHESGEAPRIKNGYAAQYLSPGPAPEAEQETPDGAMNYRIERLIDGPIPVPPIDSLLILLMGAQHNQGATA